MRERHTRRVERYRGKKIYEGKQSVFAGLRQQQTIYIRTFLGCEPIWRYHDEKNAGWYFKWVEKNLVDILETPDEADQGFLVGVDLKYPQLHDLHNDFPLAAEKLVPKKDMLSKHQLNFFPKGKHPQKNFCKLCMTKRLSLPLLDFEVFG